MTLDSSARNVTLIDGHTMPILGFGTWQIQGKSAHEAVLHALHTGYRHIDTATYYENEREVGRAIADAGLSREELFVTTKVPPNTRNARKAIEQSLADLQLDYVDLWLIHWPPAGRASLALYEQLRAAQAEGLTRSIGVSNFAIEEIDELITATGQTPAVNQIPWSPFLHDHGEQGELARRNVALEGYSPFKQSRLGNSVLVEIASTMGVTPAQVVLRWHVQHGVIVIPKSVNMRRIEENFDIFDFSLDERSMERLDDLASN